MATFWQFPRQISSVRVLCELGRDNGMELSDCLQGSNIAAGNLHKARCLISAEQEVQVVRNLLSRIGADRPLGLDAGMRQHPTTFAILGFAVLSSLTARQAVEIGVRYLRLTSAFSEVHIEESDEESLLVSDSSQLPADVQRFMIERDFATLLSVQRDVLPVHIPLTRLEFQFPRPEDIAPYVELFSIIPSFGQPFNRVGVPAALGDLKLPQGDASTLRYCEEECQRLLDSYQQRSGMAGTVRDLLMAQTRDMPTMQATAEKLEISARSLRRKLAEEDIDYESLVAEIRRSLAEEMLKTNVLTVEQIAERLGYAEVASFSRAFKRWTGHSPRNFREIKNGPHDV